jgi:hypothetical protein
VGFVVDKVALGQVFSEYFDFRSSSHCQDLVHNIILQQEEKPQDSGSLLYIFIS